MPKVSVYNLEGEAVGEIELSDTVFGAKVNEALLHDAVVTYLHNQRQGTASTKTRAEVRGGGRKPWRQKGTGRARHGSIRSPIWVGGGVTFGPKPREFRRTMPRKARRAALRSALSSKVNDGSLIVLDELTLAEPKTKQIATMLAHFDGERKPLIVLAQQDRNVELSTRNLPGADTARAQDINVYQVLNHEKVLVTKDAVALLEEALG